MSEQVTQEALDELVDQVGKAMLERNPGVGFAIMAVGTPVETENGLYQPFQLVSNAGDASGLISLLSHGLERCAQQLKKPAIIAMRPDDVN